MSYCNDVCVHVTGLTVDKSECVIVKVSSLIAGQPRYLRTASTELELDLPPSLHCHLSGLVPDCQYSKLFGDFAMW